MYKSIDNVQGQEWELGQQNALVNLGYGLFAFVVVSIVTVGAVFFTVVSN